MFDTRLIRLRLPALVLSLLLTGVCIPEHALLRADDLDDRDDLRVAEPRPYEREEFPEWAWDLRRGEIIALGVFPVAMIVSGIGFQLGRFAIESSRAGEFSQEYAPFFLSTDTGPRYNEQERIGLLISAGIISTGVAVADYLLGRLERRNRGESR